MILSYLRYLLTVETSTIKAATDIATLMRKNFLPHRATISTEIGENFGSVIAYPPRKKLRPFPLARIGPLPLLAVPRGTVMAAFAANSVGRPALEGGERTVSPLNRVGMITDRYRISRVKSINYLRLGTAYFMNKMGRSSPFL